jgi:NADH:ubiquinone oxidoreductase subunit F (NADH-binding)
MPLLDGADAPSPLPPVGPSLVDAIQRAGLMGRGGASFPVATKWRAVAQRSRGQAVIVVNGAEGEPQSRKDRLLMTTRPHLVLDGAFIAARVLRAARVILYIGERHAAARESMLRALAQRPEPERGGVTLAAAPARYVAGAESAAIHFLNDGIATPTNVPPYPFERGVAGAPTLVQNVETLAHVALVARGKPAGSILLTLAGSVARPGVIEVDPRSTIGEVVSSAGDFPQPARAVLVGGYFGTWVEAESAWDMRLDVEWLRGAGLSLGCGVIGVLPHGQCPVCETSGIMHYLAGESSAQCGPCFFGLRALSAACSRIAHQGSNAADLRNLMRWAAEVRGRGACKHPDGAVMFLQSALRVFAAEFANHEPHTARRTA